MRSIRFVEQAHPILIQPAHIHWMEPVSYTHLNSLLNMLDIIVVNDGSTDNSVEIAQKYVNKYPDVYRLSLIHI